MIDPAVEAARKLITAERDRLVDKAINGLIDERDAADHAYRLLEEERQRLHDERDALTDERDLLIEKLVWWEAQFDAELTAASEKARRMHGFSPSRGHAQCTTCCAALTASALSTPILGDQQADQQPETHEHDTPPDSS